MVSEYFSQLRPFGAYMDRVAGIPVVGFGERRNRHGRSIIYAERLPAEQVEHFDLELVAEGQDVVFWTRLDNLTQ